MSRCRVPVSPLLATLAVACATTSTFSPATPMRAGRDLPARFDPPPGFERVQPADTLAGSACLNGLRNPDDGTTLRMVRSSDTLADYEVPAERYGVEATELLRVECNSGRPVGIVKRQAEEP